jgi:cell division protein FtsI/penicillin-binding protein 2
MNLKDHIPKKRGTIRLVLVLIALFMLVRLCWKACDKSGGPESGAGRTGSLAQAYLLSRAFDSTLLSSDFFIHGNDTLIVKLTVNDLLQRRLWALFRRYHPRCAAAFVMKPRTGEVLAAVSYRNPKEEEHLPPDQNILLWHRFPAASIFKIVIAAGAMENGLINPDDSLGVTGSNYTLYKYQLRDKKTRWTRNMTMRDAFARSINPFFGKIGQLMMGTTRINQGAEKFMFNRPIPFDLPAEPSYFKPPGSAYECAEIACGFTDTTRLSPLHAAAIGASVAGNGSFKRPFLVRHIEKAGGPVRYNYDGDETISFMKQETALLMQDLMEAVVKRGTARKSFAHLRKWGLGPSIRMGGKTGSLDSDMPKGRCDWFVGYAMDPRKKEESIAVSVVIVHGALWTIHAGYIGAEAIRCYVQQ